MRQLGLFCMSCASKVSPAFLRFRAETAHEVYNGWVSNGWQVVSAIDVEGGRRLEAEISSAPESHETDSYRPSFYAMQALSPLGYAAESHFVDDPLTRAKWASRAVTSLIRNLDYYVSGRLHEAEFQEQAALIDWLERRGASVPLPEAMELAEKSAVRAMLPELVGKVIVARGWNGHAV